MEKQDNPIDSLEQDLDAILRDSINNPAPQEDEDNQPMAAPVPVTPDAAKAPSANPPAATASGTYTPPPTASAPTSPPPKPADSPYFDQFSRETKKDSGKKRETASRNTGPHWLNRYIPYIIFGGIGALLLLLAGALLTPWNFLAPSLEKKLTDLLGAPVSITTVRVKVLPNPHLQLERVAIGASHETRIGQLDIYPTFSWVSGDSRDIDKLILDQISTSTGQTAQLLTNLAHNTEKQGHVEEISFTNTTLQDGDLAWPTLNGSLQMSPKGEVSKGVFRSVDGTLNIHFSQAEKGYQLEADASGWTPPFANVVRFNNLSASGTVESGILHLSKLEGSFYGGYVNGEAELSWASAWHLGGQLTLSGIDPTTATPTLLPQTAFRGKLAATLKFDASASRPDKLWSAMNWQGSYSITDGMLANLDLARAIQEQGNLFTGGETRFSKLTGEITATPERQVLNNLQLNSGLIVASGQIEISNKRELNGRLTAQVARPDNRFKTTLRIDGTIGAPNLRR